MKLLEDKNVIITGASRGIGMGIAQVLPQLPSYSKNMYQTTRLIITGAKIRKIKDSTNVNKALDELKLET